METENKNRLAFPMLSQQGLTKEEYAMIHCNEPVPAWFKTEMPKRPINPGYIKNVFGTGSGHPHEELFMKWWSEDYQRWHTSEDFALGGKYDYIAEHTKEQPQIVPEIPESLKIEVKRHLVKLTKWHNKDQKWITEERIQHIVQWRRYFAENILLKEEQ